MKKILLLAAIIATAVSSYGQGIVNFNNRVLADPNGPLVDAPVYLNSVASGVRLLGGGAEGYRAALYGAVGNLASDSSLVLLTNPGDGQAAVPFRTTAATAGYVDVQQSGGRSIPGAGYSATVTLQVRAWEGGYATYDAALAAGNARTGKSNLIVVTTTTGPTDQVVPRLAGLQSFAITIPEPSSIALGLLGLGAVALIRRRK